MKRFAGNPAQFVRRIKRGWRTRRGRIISAYAASAVSIVVLLFAGIALDAWGQRRAAWVVAGLTALAFSVYFFGAYLPGKGYRRRVDGGLCLECGYDLRGGASRICPECGTPASPKINQ